MAQVARKEIVPRLTLKGIMLVRQLSQAHDIEDNSITVLCEDLWENIEAWFNKLKNQCSSQGQAGASFEAVQCLIKNK